MVLAAWLPIAVYLALIGPHRALHYYGIALPPLMMVSTHGIWLLMRRGDQRRTPRFYVVLAVLWFVFMSRPAIKHQLNSTNLACFQRFDHRATSRDALQVETILKYTKPDDRLFIWDYAPQIYWQTNRPQGQRYIVVTLIDQWREKSQPYVDEVVADLKRRPPKAIVISRGSMSAIDQPPSDDPLRYHDLASWIREHYWVPQDCKTGSVWIRTY